MLWAGAGLFEFVAALAQGSNVTPRGGRRTPTQGRAGQFVVIRGCLITGRG